MNSLSLALKPLRDFPELPRLDGFVSFGSRGEAADRLQRRFEALVACASLETFAVQLIRPEQRDRLRRDVAIAAGHELV